MEISYFYNFIYNIDKNKRLKIWRKVKLEELVQRLCIVCMNMTAVVNKLIVIQTFGFQFRYPFYHAITYISFF